MITPPNNKRIGVNNMTNIKDSLGIPNFGPWYIEILPNQDILEELIDMSKFVKSIIDNKNIHEFNSNNIDVQFINYGKTQLVFVVTVDNSKQYTLLINQPATKYGVGKNEFDNLNKLNQIDSELVIKPMYYFENGNYELYITPYYHQARCVGVETTQWGIWIPEPEYHFETFNEKDRKIINSAMVAMLIKLYNEENSMGIAKCRLDGGDFMLLKGFENNEISFENIINHLKLIAARELISISLDDYINKIRTELTNQENNELIITGKNLRRQLTNEEIETGIQLGLKLRKQNMQYKRKGR